MGLTKCRMLLRGRDGGSGVGRVCMLVVVFCSWVYITADDECLRKDIQVPSGGSLARAGGPDGLVCLPLPY